LAKKNDSESTVREIRRKTGKKCSAEETVRIVLDGLRDEGSIRKGSKKAVISLGGTAKDWSVASRRRTGAKRTTPDQKRCHSLKIRINREKKA
jgi:hypothetical protein